MKEERIKQIKAKMEALTERWKGKEVAPGSNDEMRRTIDRMLYRCLKRQLDKIPKTVVTVAKEVFGVEE